jgi:hypothetical protein
MLPMKYTTKEMRARLRDRVKKTMAEGVELRLRRKACGADDDQEGANGARLEQMDYYRPRARALFIAYGFIKGRTYKQVEGRFAEDNEPFGYLGVLQDWEGDEDLAIDWVDAGDKTRFQIEDEAPEEAPERPVEVPKVDPRPKGLLGRLRAAVGA